MNFSVVSLQPTPEPPGPTTLTFVGRLLAEVLASALESSGVSARVLPAPSLYDVLVDLRAAPADLVLLDLDLGDCVTAPR